MIQSVTKGDMVKDRSAAGALLSWLRGRAISFIYAGRGFALLWLTQPNFRLHIAAAICAIALGWSFHISAIEWLILAVTITIVLTAEALNTGLEKVVDFCQPDLHPLARDAKDLSAAAVLVASTGALIVGSIIFVPRLLHLFR
jgi:undecaprenol kinase